MDARKFEKLEASIVSNAVRELIIDESKKLNYSQTERLIENIKANTSITSLNFQDALEEVISYLILSVAHHPYIEQVTIKNKRLSNDFFVTLWVFLKENKSVVELKMTDCNMTDGQLLTLSPAFSINTTLRRLILSSNKLTSQSAEVFFLHLARSSSIREVNLASNFFNGNAMHYLNNALKLNSVIRSITLTGNDIAPRDVGCLVIYESASHIRKINIANNALGEMGAISFANTISAGKNILKEVNISSNAITALALSHIVAVLKSSVSLRFFACSVNYLGGTGALHLVELINSCSRLETLLAADCGFDRYGSFVIAKALSNNPSITRVDLTRADFSNYALVGLSFSTKNDLRIIDLSHCQVGVNSVSLLKEIRYYPALRVLLLSNNRIGAPGAKAIAELLQENHWLEALSISDNDLTDDDGELIAAALVRNTTLDYLDLTDNNFASKTAVKLADMLKRNNTLKDLILMSNSFDADSMFLILQALRLNTVIRSINLRDCLIARGQFYRNSLVYSTEELLVDLLKENHSICDFKLDDDLFEPQLVIDISKLLATNRKITKLLCDYHTDLAVIINKLRLLIESKGVLSPVVDFSSFHHRIFIHCMQHALVSKDIPWDDLAQIMKSSIYAESDLIVFFDRIKLLFTCKHNPALPLYRLSLFAPPPVDDGKPMIPSIKLSLNFS